MKHIKLASTLALAMGIAAAGTASAAADGGTITFHGVVTDTTCTIQGGSGTDGGANNFAVTLSGVSANNLAAAGATANPKAFQILIGGPGQGTCEDGKVASMYFLPSSPQVDATTGNLANTLANQATNVQVQLLKSDGATMIDLRNRASGLQTATIANNEATLQYSAQYFATGAATPGLIDTNVVYAVDYN